jgi:hypothetical protein
MKSKNEKVIAFLLWTFALVVPVSAQNSAISPAPVNVQVMFSEQQVDGVQIVEIRTLSLATDTTGTFAFSHLTPFPQLCTPSPGPMPLQVGSKVAGMLTATTDGRFQVNLNLSYVSAEGCKQVGNFSSPVFRTETITKNAAVLSGDVIPIVFKKSNGEELKIDITLTAQK